jgi:hypothetical protein
LLDYRCDKQAASTLIKNKPLTAPDASWPTCFALQGHSSFALHHGRPLKSTNSAMTGLLYFVAHAPFVVVILTVFATDHTSRFELLCTASDVFLTIKTKIKGTTIDTL